MPPPGTTLVRNVTEAFTHNHEANEYAIGLNYYFKRQLLKWQTDVSWYTGGNPAGGGQSPAGFIAEAVRPAASVVRNSRREDIASPRSAAKYSP